MALTYTDILKVLKTAGYTEIKSSPASKVVVVLTPESNRPKRALILQSIAKLVKGGKWTADAKYGKTTIDGFTITHKPAGKPGGSVSMSELSSLDARKFSSKAKPGKFYYHGQEIPVASFRSAKDMEVSIVDGCRKSPILGAKVAEVFDDFFRTPGRGLDWTGIDMQVRKKLGVYIGELLVGWVFLSGKANVLGIRNPFSGTPVAFHMPTDPAFRGVDSFLEMRDKSFYGISSKYGVGAKASLFGNLLEPGRRLMKAGKIKPGPLRNLMEAAEGYSEKESRSIVYSWGVRKLLGIKPAQLSDAALDKAIQQIVTQKPGAEKAQIQAAITNWFTSPRAVKLTPRINGAIRTSLPVSITAFFNQVLAAELNDSQQDVGTLREILSGKDYWQANLTNTLWEKDRGKLGFNFLSTKKAKVNFIGSKSPIGDPSAKQGWVNYELYE